MSAASAGISGLELNCCMLPLSEDTSPLLLGASNTSTTTVAVRK
jgi:hypothetical protein